jgi:hypothetical protein
MIYLIICAEFNREARLSDGTGILSGTVRADYFGDDEFPLSGVKVTATSRKAAVTRTSLPTSDDGKFTLLSLPAADDYELRPSYSGLIWPHEGIVVETGKETELAIYAPQSYSHG